MLRAQPELGNGARWGAPLGPVSLKAGQGAAGELRSIPRGETVRGVICKPPLSCSSPSSGHFREGLFHAHKKPQALLYPLCGINLLKQGGFLRFHCTGNRLLEQREVGKAAAVAPEVLPARQETRTTGLRASAVVGQ